MTTVTVPAPPPVAPRARSVLGQVGVDTAYLLVGFPLALASFVIMVTGLSTGSGMLVTLVGFPVLALTLLVAGWFGALERAQLPRVLGHRVTAPPYRRSGRGDGAVARIITPLRDPQRWLEVLHGLIRFPVATATWSITVTWWTAAAGGVTYPLWSWALPDGDAENTTPSEVLGLDGVLWDWGVTVSIGVFALLTLPWILRGCATAQAALGRELLTRERVVALQQRVSQMAASRSAADAAETAARARLERDLHDGPQQRLVRLAMDLSAAERAMQRDPADARPLVSAALQEARETLTELRTLSRGMAPAVLTDRGLEAALTAVAARSPVPVALAVDLGERLPARVEHALYHVVAEALTNVAKHAAATQVQVTVWREDDEVWAVIADDGRGGAHVAKGHGLSGLADRVGGLEGTLTIDSPAGGPTRVTAQLPCA